METFNGCSSCREDGQDAKSYPCSLERTDLPDQSLSVLHQALNSSSSTPFDKGQLFDLSSNGILALDVFEEADSCQGLQQQKNGISDLKRLLNDAVEHPVSRFLFVRGKTSRDPLCWSRAELQHIFTHYQIMPSFLKHVFTFCERDSPHLQASFQSEDYLNQRGFASGQQPRRNEVRIQHCFNLLGLEYDAREEESIRYKYRQAAAYYSFEPISGQSVMIILKANRVLQDAVAQLTKGPHTGQENSFWTNTKVHAAICEWSIQNWTSYFDHIEAKIAKLIMLANYISVSKLTNDRVIAEGITRKSTMQTAVPLTRRSTIQSGPSRTGSTYSQILDPTQWPGWRRPIRLDNLTRSGSQEQETESDASADEGTNQSDVAHIFKFDKLQALYRHAGQLQNAASVLTQNKVVMQEMIKRFTALGERDAFSQHVQMDQEVNHKFLSKTERCIRELESQQVRLGALQASVDRHISLFNGILQYNNMRIGELYAQLAKSSTDKMEELTEKTKHETVSIHVITFLTLVFLPGTFVATFFGSGVIDFENGKSTSDWGYWTIRRAALRLFCAVFLPLTFAVLGLWALAYFQARRRHAIARALAQGDEEKNQ